MKKDYWPDYWSRFFIAVPEAVLDDALLHYLRQRRLIDVRALEKVQEMRKTFRKAGTIYNKLQNKTLLQRLLIVAPELINRAAIDTLEKVGMLDHPTADMTRLVLRTSALGKGGPTSDPRTIWNRMRRVFGTAYANDILRLGVSLGYMTRGEANAIRSAWLLGANTAETLVQLRHAKSWYDVMLLTAGGIVNDKTITAARLAGLLDNRTANALLETLKYGVAEWTVWEGSKRANGLAARMAYVVSGSFSHEAMDVLTAISKMSAKDLNAMGLGRMANKLTPTNLFLLRIATQVSQQFNRNLMEQMTERRYRVYPGELPVVSFARSLKETDDALLRYLAEAADDARRRAEALAGAARGAEYALRAKALHDSMRAIWEGTGYLTIFGEHKVADAALDSAMMLQKGAYARFPDSIQKMLEYQARSGLDSFISRAENTLPLSRRVYGNLNLWTNKVQKQVDFGLLQGQSAKEIGDRVEHLINPKVMGGVKYAAMRIGRTELANAFHYTTIRHTREMPWVKGYKWNRSRSHAHSDKCDELARDDNYGMGEGVYKKSEVPDKPHPQCMCYITTVTMDDKAFIKAYNAGRFDAYLRLMHGDPGVGEQMTESLLMHAGSLAGKAAAQVALTQGISALDRMTRPGGPRVTGFNPIAMMKKKPKGLTADIRTAQMSYLDEDDPAAWGLLPEDSDDFQAGQARLAKALDGADDDLLRRQSAFKAMGYQALDPKYKTLYASNPAAREPIETHWVHGFDPDGIEDRYLSLFKGEQPGVPLSDNHTGHLLEDLSKNIYGASSYRHMNAKLRMTHGDLGAYDDTFPESDETFASLQSVARASRDDDLIDDDDLVFLSQIVDEDTAANGGKIFGLSLADTGTYYEELKDQFIEFATQKRQGTHYTPADVESMFRVAHHSDMVKMLDGSMRPTTQETMHYRISGFDWMGLDREPNFSDIGRIFQDDAFVSTEGRPEYFLNKGVNSLSSKSRQVRYMIHLPEGTMASRVNVYENEVLLARSSRFQVLDVLDVDDGTPFGKEVHLSLIDQQPTWGPGKEFLDRLTKTIGEDLDPTFKGDNDDIWDAIMGDF